MAELMTGIGREVVAQQDADLYAGIFGKELYVLNVGRRMEALIQDNNHVRIYNGIAMKEGRCINIEAGEYDEFEILNGTQGQISKKYIGYRIYTDAQGKETIVAGVSSTKVETAGLKNGASEMYMWMYEATQNGIVLESVTPLFVQAPSIANIMERFATIPTIRSGTGNPNNAIGKDGDIYIKVV